MTSLPRIAATRLRRFLWYAEGCLRRNFHAVHLLTFGRLDQLRDQPLLICLNHPSWWDPLLCALLIRRLFPERQHYGPIDAAAVQKYKFFLKLGLFPIEPGVAGAATFLRLGQAALSHPNAALWVTAQGRFADVRERPVRFAAGVGRLPRHVKPFVMLPLAFEYAFWQERFPEAFVCIGEPVWVDRSADADWLAAFEQAVEATQDRLAAKVIARQPQDFEQLLSGRVGIGGVYDLWRGMKARLHRKRFQAGHGNA